ncbi:MAG: ribonuclease P protein component [Anaerolineae bacterium]|nr:ribonuclease P protein component [Anaerolineae bacterium]
MLDGDISSSTTLSHAEVCEEVPQKLRWRKGMRLRSPQDFRLVWNQGRSWAHSILVLWSAPNGRTYSRVGIVASKKIGNAVTRNRARRLLREAARLLYPHIDPGWDLILVARHRIITVREPQVTSAVRVVLQRAGLWCEADRTPCAS